MCFLDDLKPDKRDNIKKSVLDLSGFTGYYIYKPLQKYTFQVS